MSTIDNLREVLASIFASPESCMDCRGRHALPPYAKDSLRICKSVRKTGVNLERLPIRIHERFHASFILIDETDPEFATALANNRTWHFCGCITPTDLVETIQQLLIEEAVMYHI